MGNFINTALFQTPEYAPTEGNVLHQLALDLHYSLLLRLNPDSAFHAAIHLSFTIFGRKFRVGTKIKAEQPFLPSGELKEECLRESSDHPDAVLSFGLLLFQVAFHRIAV